MRENVIQITKAVLAAVIFSLVCVLVFSLLLELFAISVTAVKPVNQALKIVAIALGGILFIRGGRGLVKGVIYGLIAITATYLLFSIISSSFSVTWLFALEMALGAVAGGISGIIGVNIKRRG